MNLPEPEWVGGGERTEFVLRQVVELFCLGFYSNGPLFTPKKNDDVMHIHFHKYVNLKKCSTVKSL